MSGTPGAPSLGTAPATTPAVPARPPGPHPPDPAATGAPGRHGARRRGRVALPSLVAGLLLAASVPPWGWWLLAFLGAGLLYWRLAGLRLRDRLLAGWVAGLGCFVPGLLWATAFNWYGAAVLMVVEALSMAAAAALVPPGRGRLVAFAGAFTLLEAIRFTWPFGGLPLGGVFLGQAGGPLLPVARLGGPLLLTMVVWAGGAGLAAAATGAAAALRGAVGGRWRAAARRSAAGGAAVALVVAAGAATAMAPDGGPPVGRLAVAAVQGGGQRGDGGHNIPPAVVLRAELAATRPLLGSGTAGGGDAPRLVLWPEDVVAVDGTLAGSSEAATLSSLARALRTTLVAGVTVDISSTHFLNEAVAWGPDGREVGHVEKVHRVPFGEYVPYRSFFRHFANLSAVPLDAVPGHGTGLLPTPAGPLGVMISYEVFYAGRARSAVRAGARLLVVPTNTSSYATSQVPSQEVAADRVQAVSEGRDLVQAAPTGFSTLVRPDGVVAAHTALGSRQVLVGTVALRSGATVYERFGDLPVLLLSGLLVVGGWALARRRRPERPRAEPSQPSPGSRHGS